MSPAIPLVLPEQHNQSDTPAEGTRRIIDGAERVFYDGYWIKVYVVPADTLELANPHRYRVRSLPATGALVRAEDEGEQMTLL